MADNIFAHGPLESSLARGATRDAADSAPPAPDYGAISQATGVPPNIVRALGDDGFNPADAAQRLSTALGAGKKMGAALAEAFPNARPERLDRIKARALEIAGVSSSAPRPDRWGGLRALANPMTYIDPVGMATGVTPEIGKGLVGGALSSGSALARAAGAEETAQTLGSMADDPSLRPDVASYREIKNPGDAGKYLAGVIGQSLPEMGAIAAAGAGGTIAGGPAGGIAAALGTSTLFNAGRNIQRQEQENPGNAPALVRAWGTGLAQGGLDIIVPGHGAGFVTRLLGAAENGIMRAGKEIGEDVATEALTETVQQIGEIAQANPDLLRVLVAPQTPEETQKSDQLVQELVDSAIGGGAAGGAFSGAALAARGRSAAEVHGAPPEASDETPGTAREPVADAPAPVAPRPRAGPLSAAAARGPAPILPDAKPGEDVTIQTPEETLGATVIGETPDGLRVSLDGEELVVPRDQIEAGEISVSRGGEQPIADPTTQVDETAQQVAEAPEQIEIEASTRGEQPVEPAAGPVSTAAMDAIQPPPVEAAPPLVAPAPTADDLRARLGFIADQARTNGGWNKRLTAMRAETEAQLADLEAAPAAMESPAPSGVGDAGLGTPPEPEGGAVASAGPAAPPSADAGAASQDALPTSDPAAAAHAADEGAATPEPAAPVPEQPPSRTPIEEESPIPGATPDTDPSASAAPALTIEPIRAKAAIIRGTGPEAPPVDVPGVSLKWDAKDGGWIFPRKHVEKVQAALSVTERPPERAAPAEPGTSADAIDAAAAEAHAEPTDGQKEAGNYRMGHVRVHGLDVTIETAKGGVRRGTAPDGTEWSVEMPAHYGYVRGTEGNDGDHVDVYLGEHLESDRAFVVDQFDPETGKLDEHKVILGASTREEAEGIYDSGFSDGSGPRRRRGIAEMSVDEFKAWLKDGDQSKPAAAKSDEHPHWDALPQADRDAVSRGSWSKAAVEASLLDGKPVMNTGNHDPQARRWIAAQKKKGTIEAIAHWAMGTNEHPVYRMKGMPLRADEAARLSRFPYMPTETLLREMVGPTAASETPGPAKGTRELEPAGQPRDDAGRFSLSEEVDEAGPVGADGTVSIPRARFASAQALGHHLTIGPFGESVQKLLDAGKLVLHEDESTLPGGKASVAKDGEIWRSGLGRVLDHAAPGSDMVRVGRGFPVFAELHVPNRAWLFRASKIRRVMEEHPEVTRELLSALPEMLADPSYVLKSASEAGSLVSIVKRLPDGRHVIVAINPTGVDTNTGAPAVVVTSVYAKDDLDWLQTQSRRGNVLYDRDGELERGQPSNGDGRSSARNRSGQVQTGSPRSRGKVLTKADLVKKSGETERVQGLTDADGTIHLVASNLNRQTAQGVLLHEMFHAGGQTLIGDAAWRRLIGRLDTALVRARQRAAAGTAQAGDWWDAALKRLPAGADAEELGAYAIENRENAPSGLREMTDGLLGRVKAFLLRRFGVQLGEVTPGQLHALAAAALREAPRWEEADIDRSIGGPNYSVAATDAPTEAQMERAERGLIGHALTQAMAGKGGVSLLAMAPGRAIFAELAGKLPAAQTYLRAKEEMDALRHEWHGKFDETAQAWRKILKGEANAKLMDLMHDATLAGIDPSQPKGEDANAVAYAGLKARFVALPEEHRAMFERVRDDYKALNDEFEKTLLDNIDKAQSVALRKAQQAHADRLREITDEGLAGKEKAEAIAEADRRLASVKRRNGWGKRAKAADLRKQFETQKVAEPYFPLARFGQYFVTARDKDGKVVHFSRHESPGVTPWITAQRAVGMQTQQTQAEAKAGLEAQGLKVETGTIGETSTRDMVDPQFVTDIEGILADAGIPTGVMDAVWQRWLETLPDLSARKSRIHRKGTPGYNPDAFRAYGFQMFHGSHQLARLRYASEMTEALEAAQRQAGTAEDPVRAGLIADEMKRRHEFVMNPKGAVWAQTLSSAAFIYHLGLSPAAGIVNLTQTSIQGPAILGAYAGGARGIPVATRELGRALRDFTDGKGWAMQSGRLSEDEKAAMKEAYRRSIIDASQAHDLAGVGETGVRYSDLRSKWMGRVSFFFHHAERLNREVTFLAAYRLARDQGLGSEAAIEKAGDLTWRVHFDNQSSSKPRFMQNDMGKVLFIFRNFSANMLWRFFRDMHQSLNGATPEERREAATQFLGTTAMLALHAGVRGVWGYSVLMMLAGMLMGGDDDDAEDALTKGVVAMLGTTLGGAVLNGVPGTLLGVDLTNRIGMPDLWFRSSDRQLEGDDERTYWWMQLLGAGVGMIDNVWRGLQMVQDGNIQRGVETSMPKFARDLLKAGRYIEEGAAMNLRGDSAYIEDVSPYQALTQALGFTPAELAEQYDRNSKLSNAQKTIEDRRTTLMGAYARPAMRGEPVPQKVLDGIAAFNAEYPEIAITGKSLKASIGSRKRSAEQKVHGVTLNPKLAQRLTREAAPAIYGQ